MTAERSNPATVLVVEDDRTLAELYAEWLGGTYRVETAYHGSDGLERLDETVDVVLLDRMMPGLSGEEVLEEIRSSGTDCRVAMVSAVTPDLDIVKMGFDAYLEKPVDEAELRETVDRMLTRGQYEKRLQELFSLIERQDALEAVKGPETLETSEEYQALTDRLQAVERDVESLLTGLPDDDFRVAVERLQRTATERTSERRYESLTTDVLDTSREATVVVDAEGTVVLANEPCGTLLGLDRSDVRGRQYGAVASEQFERIEAESGTDSLASLVRAGLASQGEEIEAVVRVPGDGSEGQQERWLEYWSAPVETGLYTGGRIEHYHDITGRYTREQHLRTLNRSTRELMDAPDAGTVADRAVTTAATELDFAFAAAFLRDDGTGGIRPAAHRVVDSGIDPSLPTLDGGDDPVWTAFAEQAGPLERSTYREQHAPAAWLDDPFGDWVACPLGRQGVLVVAAATGTALSATERSLARLWAGNVRQALDRVARESDLRARDRELQRQNDRLSRLDRINRLIQSIGPAIVSADSRAEIEAEACERLVQLDRVTGAWIADVDPETGQTVCRASAGRFERYLAPVREGGVPGEDDSSAALDRGPARRADDTSEAVLIRDLMTVEPGSWWRDQGLDRGTHAVVAVPITHGSTRFGALEIHIDRPQGVHDDEVDALTELGAMIGHAVGAVRQREALLSGGALTLEFRVAPDPLLSRVAEAVDGPLAVEDVSWDDDGDCAVIVAVEASDAERPGPGSGERITSNGQVSVLRDDPERAVYRASLPGDSPLRTLVEPGAALSRVEMSGTSADMRVAVTLSQAVDVRDYVERVTARASDGAVELLAKREQARDQMSRSSAVATLDEQLTSRQREALKMAFHAGYFDRPRRADSESVAAALDIAQSTLSQHLRTAERKLLAELYG